MEDRELWEVMRIKAALDELEDQAARRRVLIYILDYYGLGKLDEADVKTDEITEPA